VAVVNQDFIAADGTSLDTFDSDWDFTTGADANTDIQSNRLELQEYTTVVAYHSGSSEQQAEIVLDPSATGTARRIGPAINVTSTEEGQYFYLDNDNGTYYTTITAYGGSVGWIGSVALPANTYAIANTLSLRLTETSNDGTDVTFSVFIDDNDEGSFVALAAPSVAGNDGIYSRRNDNDSPAVIQSFSSGSAVATNIFASTLSPATLVAVGEAANTGTLTATLSPATLSAAGNTANSGNVVTTLGPATLSATGNSANYGNLAVTLAPATLAAIGDVVNTGTLAVTLAPATLVATGNMKGLGTFSTVLAPATLVAANGAYSGSYTDLIVGEMTYSIQTDIVR